MTDDTDAPTTADQDVCYLRVDPATGRILGMSGAGLHILPEAMRQAMNMIPVPAAVAEAYHADPTDRSWIDGRLGRCAPLPLRLETDARVRRVQILASSDYLMASDAPISPEKAIAWRDYRQALRDITAQPGWPTNIIWPAHPDAS